MSKALLATKVRVPPKPERVVHRSRLIDILEQHLPNDKLILLSAPAGYGKTTLLAQWAYASKFKIAWLEISKEDNDLERFFRYLLAAWEKVQPGIRASPLGILLSGMAPDLEAVRTAFVNAANDSSVPMVFVLDDIHRIDQAPIYQALTFLLDHLPPNFHFILAGRADPPLPLARYRARRQLFVLRAKDLRFLPDETGELMNGVMGFDLHLDEILQLQIKMEGWIAGLHLLALTFQHGSRVSGQITIWGRQRFITDYLREEVLAHLSPEMHSFLLQTSILDRLCSSLCDAVTQQAGGQAMLESLERENLFLMPLDDHREWFRYHHLFADFLQSELERVIPQEVVQLHQRAARWYLARDLPEQAIQHAIDGDDAELMAQIGELIFEIKLLSGEYRLLKSWLDRLPEQWQSQYPIFGLFQAAILLFTGELQAGTVYVDAVEQRLRRGGREDTRQTMGRITAVRCSIACFQNELNLAEQYASKAFLDLPLEDHAFRATIYHSLGDTYRRNGRWDEARQCYENVLAMVQAPSFTIRSVHVYGALADLDLRQGRLRAAAACWRKALAVIEEPGNWGSFPLPLIGWVYIRIADILYEWNALRESEDYLAQGLTRVQLGGDIRAIIAGSLLACRLYLAQGNLEAAEKHLAQARPLVEQALFPDWTSRFEHLQVELWVAQDHRRAVIDWTETALQRSTFERWPDIELSRLALVRGLLLKGDRQSLSQAFAQIERILETVEADGQMSVQIEGLLLQALIEWSRGDQPGAMIPLERALRLAEPEGYIRLFVDLGLPMLRLLQEARSREVMPEMIRTLFAAFGAAMPTLPHGTAALPEPLTTRELEILQQLAAGMTNREIAEKLVISAETVKKHTASIYSKLGVRGRTEAAARARQLDLLR